MLFEDPKVIDCLRRIVCRVNNEASWRDDLMQEALVHLWRTEIRWPAQTLSWYLQGCQFHLLNYLGAGRSVDSAKRRQGREELDLSSEGHPCLIPAGHDDDVSSEVSAQDMLEALLRRLPPLSRTILFDLHQGLGAREIARKLELSHRTINKHRRRIADQARRLGLTPGLTALPRRSRDELNAHRRDRVPLLPQG